jgi:CheY-like chemotaxis protein
MTLDRSRIPAVILVVEDEMMLRMRAVDMVEDAGYAPVEAVDADGAVAILESRSDIALMVTDIQMPGSMDGLRLAHAVRERWPSIKIIVVSGQLKQPSIDLPADSRPCLTPAISHRIRPESPDCGRNRVRQRCAAHDRW